MPVLPILLAACLFEDASIVVRPLHLGASPPPVRSARHALIAYRGSIGAADGESTTREEAEAAATELVARARAGADFAGLAAEISDDPDARSGAVLGTFVPGVLAPDLDRFLFAADVGAVSDPIVDERGVHVLQRIESHAAVRQILVRGLGSEARARCEAIVAELRGGADFAELARKRSEDLGSGSRGGLVGIYERGAHDTLLKAECFRMSVGEIRGPIESPIGWHVLQRVPVEGVDPALSEPTFVRLRGILLRIDDRTAGPDDLARAAERALDLYKRILAGEDMRELARRYDEDPGGKEREGDLGWIHRAQPGLPQSLQRACLLPVGDLAEPARTAAGYLLLRRER